MRELARMLTANNGAADSENGAYAVNRNLQEALVRFAGTGGFGSLLRRSVSLAGEEMPALRAAKVAVDGRLEGIAAYSGEDDRLFRRNVTGDSGESALRMFSTLVGHDQSRTRSFPGRDRIRIRHRFCDPAATAV